MVKWLSLIQQKHKNRLISMNLKSNSVLPQALVNRKHFASSTHSGTITPWCVSCWNRWMTKCKWCRMSYTTLTKMKRGASNWTSTPIRTSSTQSMTLTSTTTHATGSWLGITGWISCWWSMKLCSGSLKANCCAIFSLILKRPCFWKGNSCLWCWHSR